MTLGAKTRERFIRHSALRRKEVVMKPRFKGTRSDRICSEARALTKSRKEYVFRARFVCNAIHGHGKYSMEEALGFIAFRMFVATLL